MRLKKLTFITVSGGTQQLTVQDYNDRSVPQFYGGETDEAMSGKLRSNIRDFKREFELFYGASNEPAVYESIVNNILTDIQAGEESFSFGVAGDLIDVTVSDEFVSRALYARQVGIPVPAMKLSALNLNLKVAFITEDWGLVTGSVTESEDWGLVTGSVTESEDWGRVI